MMLNELSLPTEASIEAGTTASDGSSVYPSTDGLTDVAIQEVANGARILTVLNGPAASSEYTYTFGEGSSLTLNEDGAVTVDKQVDERTVISGIVDAPWAVDATGKPVPTHYEVSGTTLTQVIDHSNDVTYPVVADPKYTPQWFGGSFLFTAAETADIGSNTSEVGALAVSPGERGLARTDRNQQ